MKNCVKVSKESFNGSGEDKIFNEFWVSVGLSVNTTDPKAAIVALESLADEIPKHIKRLKKYKKNSKQKSWTLEIRGPRK